MQSFSAGKVLSDAFEIFKARFVPMAILTVVYYAIVGVLFGTIGMATLAPLLTAAATGEPANPGALMAGMGGGILLLYLVIYAVNFWQQGAMCRLTSDRHDGSLGDAFTAGLHCVLPLFAVAIIAFIALLVGSLVIGLVTGIATVGTDSPAPGMIFGLIALVGLVYVALRFSMVLPTIAIEEVRNPLTAMGRSWAMTKGHVLKLFLIFLIVFGTMAVIGLTLVMLTIGSTAGSNVPGMGAIVSFGLAMVALGLSVGIYLMAVVGAIHRQLGGQSIAEVEATFA